MAPPRTPGDEKEKAINLIHDRLVSLAAAISDATFGSAAALRTMRTEARPDVAYDLAGEIDEFLIKKIKPLENESTRLLQEFEELTGLES
jgi:hypothetical protein